MDIYSEKKAMKDLNSLYAEAVYGKPKSAGQELASREKRDDAAGAPKKMIVTRADKKANTKAYQNYKAGAKGYAAADHLKNEEYAELYASINEKKAAKDYDGDGKIESGTAEYKGSKDKAIKKAMAKEGYGKKKKKHDCASKVKHEEYGVGNCIKEMHDLDENGNVAHYDVMFDHGVEKHVPVESLQILEGHMHEHFIKEKESYDTVAAVIDYDRSKKGTDDATYDSMHGKKKQAKKERDYAAFERGKMKKDDPNWKHKKGSTSESFSNWRDDLTEYTNVVDEPESKAAKKVKESNVKNKVVIDPEVKLEQALGGEVEVIEEDKDTKIKEEILWDRVAEALDELGEMNDVQFKVSPMTDEEILELNWDVFDENYQAMRNPEKEEKKDKRSAREKRMADPEKGINSPAFKEFMKQYGG